MDFIKYLSPQIFLLGFLMGTAPAKMTSERIQKSVKFLITSDASKTLTIMTEKITEHPEHTLAVVDATFSNEGISTEKVVEAAIDTNPALAAEIAATAAKKRPGDRLLIQRALRDALANYWEQNQKSNQLSYDRRDSLKFWEERIARGRVGVVLVLQDALHEKSVWASTLGEYALDKYRTSSAQQAIIQAILRAAPDQTAKVLEMVSRVAEREYAMARRYAQGIVTSKEPTPVAIGEVYFQPFEAMNYSLNLQEIEGGVVNISAIEQEEED